MLLTSLVAFVCSVPSLTYIVKSFVALLILWSLQLVFLDKSTSLPGFDQLVQLVSVLELHMMQGNDVTMPVTVHDACTQLCMPACPVKVHIRLAMGENFQNLQQQISVRSLGQSCSCKLLVLQKVLAGKISTDCLPTASLDCI